jgi:hypothetical protein
VAGVANEDVAEVFINPANATLWAVGSGGFTTGDTIVAVVQAFDHRVPRIASLD